MKKTIAVFVLALFSLAVFWACNSEDEDPIIVGSTDDDDDTTDDDDDDTTTDDDDDSTPEGDCESWEDGCCDETQACSSGTCYGRVCVTTPSVEAELYWENSHFNVEEQEKEGSYDQLYDNDGNAQPLNMDCVGRQYIDDPANEGTTQARAKIKVFGVAAVCDSIQADIFYEFDENGNRYSTYDDTNLAVHAAVTEPMNDNAECFITIEGVPTNRWLVFKTYEDDLSVFRNTYQYNNYIKDEDAADGYPLEFNAISNTSWQLIPTTMGARNGIQSNNAAVSGTVKDCAGNLIRGATVGITVLPSHMGYFNKNVSNLLPDTSATFTSPDATYAMVNVPAETGHAITLKAMAKINGEVTEVGEHVVFAFPGAVTVCAFRFANPINYSE